MSKIVVIAGPTASGKTKLSVELARMIGGEVVCADSMQIYKHLDIGTAKVTKEEMGEVVHHLFDEVEPSVNFSVSEYHSRAVKVIDEIQKRNKVPILVGGTGLYIDSVIYSSYSFDDGKTDLEYRSYLENLAKEKGNEFLFEMLKEVDYEYSLTTHQNNVQRVVRAIEYHHTTGNKKSDNVRQRTQSYEHSYYFALEVERKLLYDRINCRVDEMMKRGLLDEVKSLLDMGYDKKSTAFQAIGYKEIIEHLDGEIPLEDAIDKIKQYSRNYAKRQYTWFRHNSDVRWLETEKYSSSIELAEMMKGIINEI